MADTDRTNDDAKAQLFDQLRDVKAGFLHAEKSGQHGQPMAPHADRDAGVLWFITSRQSDLARAVTTGCPAHFTFIGKKHDYYASMEGTLTQVEDQQKLDEIWSAIAAAWFDKGRDDPDVTLLRLDMAEAAIWSNTANPITFGMQIAAANLREEKKPDIGEHTIVRWRSVS